MDSLMKDKMLVFGAGLAAGALAMAVWNRRSSNRSAFGFRRGNRSWFCEFGSMWPGQAMSLEVQDMLFEGRSKFQDVKVFQSTNWGKVLVLDGVIQCTERDEFSYQEMMTHVALFAHKSPKRVLVIGGGDGGVLREIAKHKSVEDIQHCELDEMVIECSKKFLPFMASGFDDPRVTVKIEDGDEYVGQMKNQFDVIIVDSSDPIGPADILFQEPFYRKCYEALQEGGILACQGECMWLHIPTITEVQSHLRKMFDQVEYSNISIPTYPCGQIGCILAAKGTASKIGSIKTPQRKLEDEFLSSCRYYSADVHEASFVLPTFVRRQLA